MAAAVHSRESTAHKVTKSHHILLWEQQSQLCSDAACAQLLSRQEWSETFPVIPLQMKRDLHGHCLQACSLSFLHRVHVASFPPTGCGNCNPSIESFIFVDGSDKIVLIRITVVNKVTSLTKTLLSRNPLCTHLT